jgi:hypothetical protein
MNVGNRWCKCSSPDLRLPVLLSFEVGEKQEALKWRRAPHLLLAGLDDCPDGREPPALDAKGQSHARRCARRAPCARRRRAARVRRGQRERLDVEEGGRRRGRGRRDVPGVPGRARPGRRGRGELDPVRRVHGVVPLALRARRRRGRRGPVRLRQVVRPRSGLCAQSVC